MSNASLFTVCFGSGSLSPYPARSNSRKYIPNSSISSWKLKQCENSHHLTFVQCYFFDSLNLIHYYFLDWKVYQGSSCKITQVYEYDDLLKKKKKITLTDKRIFESIDRMTLLDMCAQVCDQNCSPGLFLYMKF